MKKDYYRVISFLGKPLFDINTFVQGLVKRDRGFYSSHIFALLVVLNSELRFRKRIRS